MLNHNPEAAYIAALLHRHGYNAYLVGGRVRDTLRRRLGQCGAYGDDCDMATDAYPADILRVCAAHVTHTDGAGYGCVSVTVDGVRCDVTTLRTDGVYRDARRPSHVAYTRDLARDLLRRDFTVNAMAVDLNSGALHDPTRGASDVHAHIIRTVGDPLRRFNEDALRILRALRFASRLGYDIESDTAAAMCAVRRNLCYVSRERVTAEVWGILCGGAAYDVWVRCGGALCGILPRMGEVDGELLRRMPDTSDALLRMALLLRAMGEVAVPRVLLLSNDQARVLTTLLSRADEPLCDVVDVRRMLRTHGESVTARLLEWSTLLHGIPERCDIPRILSCAAARCHTLAMLAVNGRDALDAGLRGVDVGVALNALLDDVIAERLPNDRDALLDRLTTTA